MKKILPILLLLVAALTAAANDIFLQPVPKTGPEHGTMTEYWVVKPGKLISRESYDSLAGNLLISERYKARVDTIVDHLLVMGLGINEEKILSSYLSPGKTFYGPIRTEEKPMGWSKWGFYEHVLLTKKMLRYSSQGKSPTVMIIQDRTIMQKMADKFRSMSVVMLIVTFLLGALITRIFFDFKQVKREVAGSTLIFVIYLAATVFGIISLIQAWPISRRFFILNLICLILPLVVKGLKSLWGEMRSIVY